MDEQLWFMQQQSRVLQEFRTSISLMWDDEAAQTLNRNLLNPHQEDDEAMVGSFVQQNFQLGESAQTRGLVLELVQKVTELLHQIMELIERVDEDTQRSVQYFQQYRSFYAEAQGMLPDIDQLTGKANKAGNSAPYNPD